MKSTDSHAHFNLGLIYAATGRNAQAVEELQAALAADPNNPKSFRPGETPALVRGVAPRPVVIQVKGG